MTDRWRGALAMVGASAIWGLSGIYFHAIAHIPPLEVMAHRAVWSLLFLLAVFALQRRLGALKALLADRASMLRIGVTALMISANWFVYIFAVQNGFARDASLGYYIFPLLGVLIGLVMFGEGLDRLQWGAVALVAVAVTILTLWLGKLPWIAMLLALTFAWYGVIKKRLPVGPMLSVGAEFVVMLPVSLIFLIWLAVTGQGAFGTNAHDSALLVASLIFTGVPLVMLSYAFRRLPYATLGLIQYLNPTLQMLVAVIWLGEALTGAHIAALTLIWAALALYSADLWRQESAARKAGSKPSTSATKL